MSTHKLLINGVAAGRVLITMPITNDAKEHAIQAVKNLGEAYCMCSTTMNKASIAMKTVVDNSQLFISRLVVQHYRSRRKSKRQIRMRKGKRQP